MKLRRYGDIVDARACRMLGENSSERTVLELSARAPILTGGETLIERVRITAEKQRAANGLIVQPLSRESENSATKLLPRRFAYATVGDIESFANRRYTIIYVGDLDVDFSNRGQEST